MTRTQRLWGTAAAAILATASAAHAQTKAAPQDTTTSVDTLVVTAERREERLQDTPAVVNVVSGDTIDKLHVDDVSNLSNFVPGLKMDGNATDQLRLGLRGAFSSANSPGTGQSVGLYIDGIPYGHTSDLSTALFGVKQVEVLRGPQGTLYGQNVVGGLINIVTKDPGPEARADVKLSYSSFNRFDLDALVSGPMTDTVSGSLAIHRSQSDGWQRNLVNGDMLDQLNQWSTRGKLIWKPTDKLTVKVIGELSSDDTKGVPRSALFGSPLGWTIPSSIRDTYLVFDGGYDSRASDIAVLADYDLGWATLSEAASYQRNRPQVLQPLVTGPVSWQTDLRKNDNDTFTQELRLAGVAQKLHWQVGAFYLHDNVSQSQDYTTDPAPGTRSFSQGVTSINVLNQRFKVLATSFSVFGEGTYDFNDVISLTVGGRYNWDHKDSNFHDYGTPSVPLGGLTSAPFVVQQSHSWDEFTPKVTLNAKWSDVGPLDGLLLYATFSKGYLAGDFFGGGTAAGSTGTVPPEIAKNYEGGFKTTFWGRRATFDTSYFHVDYTNLQTLSLTAAGNVAVASTDATAWGIESSFTVTPFAGFTLGVDYNYLNTRIADGAKAPDGSSVGGFRLPQSPPYTYDFNASYRHELGDGGVLRLTAAYVDKGPVYFDVRNLRTAPVLPISKTRSLDAEIAYTRDRWEVSLWGKNLTDENNLLRASDSGRNYALTAAQVAAGQTFLDGVYSEPRSIGVSLRWTY